MGKRKKTWCLVVFLFCGFLWSGKLFAITTAPYFPIQEGNSWTYNWTYNNTDTGTYTTTVLDGTVLVNGVATVVLQDSDGFKLYITNDQNGIRIHRVYDPSEWFDDWGYRSLDVVYSPPMQMASAEATVGSSIFSSGTATVTISGAGTVYLTYSLTSTIDGLDNITVPAGSYQAVKITREDSLTGNVPGEYVSETSTGTDWLVKDIGLVKSSELDAEGLWEEVLIATNVAPQVPPIVYNDFNGDLASEILWHNTSNGQNRIWRMNGLVKTAGRNINNLVGSGWVVGGTGDFDADNKTDIMWRDQGGNGQNRLWLMDGFVRKQGSVLPLLMDTNWVVGGINDFDGDGQADIHWRNTVLPRNRIWLMNGYSTKQRNAIPNQANEWAVGGTGDFDGDGKADILWRNTDNGQNRIWLMSGLTRSSGANIPNLSDTNWVVGGLGDFDGDGKTDILWRNPLVGQNRIWLMDGLTRKQGSAIDSLHGSEWVVGSIGDYNADGRADILWRNTDNGQNRIWIRNGDSGSIAMIGTDWIAAQ